MSLYPRPEDGLPPCHPGEYLKDELAALDLSAAAFARHLGVPANRITEILNGRRSITADTALRLAQYFGSGDQGAELWLDLQKTHDFKRAKTEHGLEIARTVKPLHAA